VRLLAAQGLAPNLAGSNPGRNNRAPQWTQRLLPSGFSTKQSGQRGFHKPRHSFHAWPVATASIANYTIGT